MSPAQQRACDELLPRFGIAFGPAPLDFARVFGRAAPVVLEIGFGMGETTAAIAQAHPDVDFLGVEVHLPGVGALLKRIDELGSRNVRVIRHDAVEVVDAMIAPDSLAARPRLLPGPVAEEAPPQASAADAAVRPRARASASRPAATCTSRPTGRPTPRKFSPRSPRSRCSRTPRPASRRARRGGRRPSSSARPQARPCGVRPGVQAPARR